MRDLVADDGTRTWCRTYLGQALNLYREGEPAGFIGSIVGAMLLLFLYRLVSRPRLPRA